MPNITMAGKTDKNFTFIVLPNTSIVKLLEKKVHKWELKSELNTLYSMFWYALKSARFPVEQTPRSRHWHQAGSTLLVILHNKSRKMLLYKQSVIDFTPNCY